MPNRRPLQVILKSNNDGTIIRQRKANAKKTNNTYELSIFVVSDRIVNDEEAMQLVIGLRTDMQSLFPDNKVIIKLVVDNVDNVVKTFE